MFGYLDILAHSRDLLFYLKYDENGSFLNSNNFKSETDVNLCFDCFKLLKFNSVPPLCDIKILYELQGYKFDNIISLSGQCLGEEQTKKYCDLSDRIKSHIKSYKTTKINTDNYQIDQLIPKELIHDLYKERSIIVKRLYDQIYHDQDLFNFYENYFYGVVKNIYKINQQYVNIDLNEVKKYNNHFVSSLHEDKVKLDLKAVGAKTGRLSFKKGSLNIFNLPRDMRSCIVSSDNCKIVQFDYKSFQPRIAIHLTKDDEFKDRFRDVEDIYSKFSGDRDEVKLSFLGWLFSEREDFNEEAYAIRELSNEIYEEIKKKNKIINCFGRILYYSGEPRHTIFQNFITSTEVDMILSVLNKIIGALKNRKSRLLFPFHDAIVFEIHDDEQFLIDKIKHFMEVYHEANFKTLFPVEIKIGDNFRDLENLK